MTRIKYYICAKKYKCYIYFCLGRIFKAAAPPTVLLQQVKEGTQGHEGSFSLPPPPHIYNIHTHGLVMAAKRRRASAGKRIKYWAFFQAFTSFEIIHVWGYVTSLDIKK